MRTFGISKRFSPKSSAQSNRGLFSRGRFRRFGQQSIFFKYRITHQSNFYSNQLNMYHFKPCKTHAGLTIRHPTPQKVRRTFGIQLPGLRRNFALF